MKNKILLLLLLAPLAGFAQTKIPADHPGIHIHGAKYIQKIDSVIHIERFPDSLLALSATRLQFNPVKAHVNTGVLISFKTSSPKIKANFRVAAGENRGSVFGIFQNGQFSGSVKFTKNDGPILSFEITPEFPGTETIYEITLPIWANAEFMGLELDAISDLVSDYVPVEKKIYVAYGNSITHGTGQSATFETYPFQVSRKFNWELFNVAVGGAKTSVAIADMLRDDFDRIDFMTILIGYNDYNFQGIDTTEYKNRYTAVLNSIREKHQSTEIFCITQTFTWQDSSKTSGIPIADFRTALTNLVKSRQAGGDRHLYLIRGEAITSAGNLKDRVHFTVEGAKLFADSLAHSIEAFLDSTATEIKEGNWQGSNSENSRDWGSCVYPNPTHGYLNVATDKMVENIRIFNVLGQQVKFLKSGNRLQLAGLPKGIYFLSYKSRQGNFKSHKFTLK